MSNELRNRLFELTKSLALEIEIRIDATWKIAYEMCIAKRKNAFAVGC